MVNIRSAEVNGSPSDHFIPSRNRKVNWVLVSFFSNSAAMLGTAPAASQSHSSSPTPAKDCITPASATSVWARCSVPPNVPGPSHGSTTIGCAGRRSSSAGRSPASTRSVSIGDSRASVPPAASSNGLGASSSLQPARVSAPSARPPPL